MITIPKAWGEERILVNEPEYAAKILVIKKGAGSSWHRHKVKKEHFYCMKGSVCLQIEMSPYTLHTKYLIPGGTPTVIYPGQWHQFHGLEDSEILEVSMHDDPADTQRRTVSYAAGDS